MAEKKKFKAKVKETYNRAKTKVSETSTMYRQIYNKAYARGYEDCIEGRAPLFGGLVAAAGYGSGFNAKKQRVNSEKKYERRTGNLSYR